MYRVLSLCVYMHVHVCIKNNKEKNKFTATEAQSDRPYYLNGPEVLPNSSEPLTLIFLVSLEF